MPNTAHGCTLPSTTTRIILNTSRFHRNPCKFYYHEDLSEHVPKGMTITFLHRAIGFSIIFLLWQPTPTNALPLRPHSWRQVSHESFCSQGSVILLHCFHPKPFIKGNIFLQHGLLNSKSFNYKGDEDKQKTNKQIYFFTEEVKADRIESYFQGHHYY